MALELSVPDSSARLLAQVELDPHKVERWLAGLPLLNTAGTAQKLDDTLIAYNRMPLEPDLRFALLELYRPPIQQIVLELQKQFVGLPLPLPERARRMAEQTLQFQRELAYGYKQVVLAHGETAALRNDQVAALQRAIRHLTEVLAASYLSYSPFPVGTWKEIHALYAHAEKLGFGEVEIEDALSTATGKGTIVSAYKHALLLDLCDPYHLPSRMVAHIDRFLESHASLAELGVASRQVESVCQFLIDLRADRAGVANAGQPVEPVDTLRLLNTVELARTLHIQLTTLQAGVPPSALGLPAELYADGEEMLRRLVHVWGVNPKRVFRRNARPNLDIDVIIGTDAINYWLNGGRRFLPSAAFVGPHPQRTCVGTFGKKQLEAENTDHEYSVWQLQDESAGGMSLRKTGLVKRPVRVGDLLATRFSEDQPWSISVVRWVRSPNPSRVEIGTQRMAPSAQPVLVKTVTGDKKESDFLAALLLPEIPMLKQPQTLVTPRNVFRPNRILYMDDGHRLERLVGKQLIELSAGFERFQFQPS
ncbi:GTPase [Sulfurifustis variabilis]|uniref:GTPase n=1 Tax=Sulfurifustis variabilis TaxID=1675686 RepID=A0A1B4V8S6_9GAMM|nr:hypothetical protein [Sulfurifustis variabilis]BAU49042.1 GTPase [Sulfurifustis variabilis]